MLFCSVYPVQDQQDFNTLVTPDENNCIHVRTGGLDEEAIIRKEILLVSTSVHL